MLRRIPIKGKLRNTGTAGVGLRINVRTGRKGAYTPQRSDHVETAFALLSFSAIFLQKFGISFGGGSVGFDAFIILGLMFWLLVQGEAGIDPMRLILYSAVSCTAMTGLVVTGKIGNLASLIQFLAMYATLLFAITADRPLILRCLNKFQFWMSCIAFIVIGQQILQYTIGNRYWPNLNEIIPQGLLIGGYAYLRPYEWNSPYLTPNGIFFLEPSACSGFLALALASEIIWFKRIAKLVLFTTALIANVAGSGPAVVLLFSPLLLLKLDQRLVKWLFGLGIPVFVVAFSMGVFSHILSRSAEFHEDNSSAYARIVVPFASTINLATNPYYLLVGNGAGSSPKSANQVQWPADKLIYEYGLPTAVLFHIFLLVAMISTPASRTIALILLVPHLFFGGGFVSHTNIMMLVMFGSLLRLRPELSPATNARRRRYDALRTPAQITTADA